MPEFRQAHEVAAREAARGRMVRTGWIAFVAVFAVGWFAPDRLSYAAGVITVVVIGQIVGILAHEEKVA
jgi:hypothetical protein